MNIVDFCLKYKVTTIMAYVLAVVFGIMGFASLPDMELPMAVVMIVGMVVSTIVTLLFTPVYDSLIDSLTGSGLPTEHHIKRLI